MRSHILMLVLHVILLASKSCRAFTAKSMLSPISHERRTVMTPLLQSSEEGGGPDSSTTNDENASTSPHIRAIEEAMEATRTYGATSKEARVAWEIAEEIEDSIFSPCSKRCDPLPRSASTSSEDTKPLFVDKSTTGDGDEGL